MCMFDRIREGLCVPFDRGKLARITLACGKLPGMDRRRKASGVAFSSGKAPRTP